MSITAKARLPAWWHRWQALLPQILARQLVKRMQRRRFPTYSDDERSAELTWLLEVAGETLTERPLLECLPAILTEYLRDDYRFTAATGTAWDRYSQRYIGQHYRLLPAIARAMQAQRICEIGTATGESARCLLDNTEASVLSIDIKPWDAFPFTYLRAADFASGRLTQVIADLGNAEQFHRHLSLLSACDLFFVDAAKDGVFEPRFFGHIAEQRAAFAGKLFILDDIRLGTMVRCWHDLPFIKLDISGIGHWAGTGLVLIDAVPD